MNGWINLNALWKIVVVGLLAGAGLPAVFAIGLWAISLGRKPTAVSSGTVSAGTVSAGVGSAGTGSSDRPVDDDRILGGSSVGLVVGAACFLVFLAGIATGIYYIVSGA